jgi:hypothetical protein
LKQPSLGRERGIGKTERSPEEREATGKRPGEVRERLSRLFCGQCLLYLIVIFSSPEKKEATGMREK